MMTTKMPVDEKYSLRSVNRAIDVLETLSNCGPEGMGVGEIAEAIDVSRSTAFTLLQTLTARGLVADVRNRGGRVYRLGIALVYMGDRAIADISISRIAMPILQELTDATQLTSRLAILDDGYAVAVARVDSTGPFKVTASLGRRELPHCSSVGKALLAGLSEEEVRKIIFRLGMPRRTTHTLVEPDALISELGQVRANGYAFDNEEDNVGVVCIGAPVYGRGGEIVAAISITTMKLDRKDEDLNQMGATVRYYADKISNLLGGLRA
jgi:IclR family acetate operon transcriptional repressor